MSTPANRRVLVVDDTPSIHEDFRRILSGSDASAEMDAAEEALFGETSEPGLFGFEVDSAYQGQEGLARVEAALAADRPYSLAFVDMRMPPGWDGVQTIQEIWKVDPRLQVVICTAHSDYSWDEVLGKLGVEDRLLILKKPFDNIEVAQLSSALTTKWDMTRRAEQRVNHLEFAVRERTEALEIANRELADLVRQYTQLAMHDTLTGLPNRLLFADRATHALEVSRRDGSHVAVLMVDLDRFKEVNDTLGHHCGDLLLKEVADRLSTAVRPGDTVARFGGDEFALLLPDGGSVGGASVANRIARAFDAPFLLGDASVGVEASVGIAAAGPAQELRTLEELLRHADIAMYKAKVDRSGFAHYSAGDDDATPDRLTLIGEMRQALDCEEFVVYYQPKIAVDSGEWVGVEALLRWQHPTRGLLLPGAFIALAEESTLIKRLTTMVVDRALRCCRRWLDRGVRLQVAVNISARSLCDPEFPSTVSDRLTQADVPAELLTIELTEGTVMANPGMAVRILHALRDIGVRLSVDDYGTGYSSMAYLKDLPINEMKIDRVFIKGLTSNAKDAAIVQSATDLAHHLGLCVVAEGVEDEQTLIAIKTIGADVAQGYHLGRPMPEDVLHRWLAHRTEAMAGKG